MNATAIKRIPHIEGTKAHSTLGTALQSLYICSLILTLFLLTTPATRHWFVLPVLACGAIVGFDAIRVIRGEVGIFDPIGLVGVIGIHFFFFAPLLHVRFDYWMGYVSPPSDWREWLGQMALLNLLGLIAYVFARTIAYRRPFSKQRRVVWKLDERTFRNVIFVSLTITGLLQFEIYRQFGGISGYINSFEGQAGSFENLGILFSISESFPILAMMAFVVWARHDDRRKTWFFLGSVLIGYVLVTLLFGGLRGSRSNTIWALFWAVGLIHFWLRSVPRKYLLIGAAFVIGFMYFYGFYKSLGTDTESG